MNDEEYSKDEIDHIIRVLVKMGYTPEQIYAMPVVDALSLIALEQQMTDEGY